MGYYLVFITKAGGKSDFSRKSFCCLQKKLFCTYLPGLRSHLFDIILKRKNHVFEKIWFYKLIKRTGKSCSEVWLATTTFPVATEAHIHYVGIKFHKVYQLGRQI